MLTIPRYVHFIWAGGEKPMLSDSVTTIKDWARLNPEFEIWLWIDNTAQVHDEDSVKTTLAYYQSVFRDRPNIRFKDVTEQEVIDSYSRYEIGKLLPNFGSSSDMLRYRILFKFGGAYFDSDVLPNYDYRLEGTGIFRQYYDQHQLFVDEFSQGQEAVGNDAFITTPKNPVFLFMLEEAERRYRLQSLPEYVTIDQMRLEHIYQGTDFSQGGWIATNTIYRTGPKLVRTVIFDDDNQLGIGELSPRIRSRVQVQSMHDSEHRLTRIPEEGNRSGWTERKVIKGIESIPLSNLLQRVLGTIQFEAECYKIIRLDTHIRQLVRASGETIGVVSQRLIQCLEHADLNLEQIQFAELPAEQDCVKSFYQSTGIVTRAEQNLYKYFANTHSDDVESLTCRAPLLKGLYERWQQDNAAPRRWCNLF